MKSDNKLKLERVMEHTEGDEKWTEHDRREQPSGQCAERARQSVQGMITTIRRAIEEKWIEDDVTHSVWPSPNKQDYDTCVLRLTRVRAQPQASKSVASRVCIVFRVIAHALVLDQVCKHCLASVVA